MNARVIRLIVSHEFAWLARNTIMWFRFALFYLVFGAVMVRAVRRADWEDLSNTLVGLMIIAAVGIATSLAAETFAQEKERGTMEALLLTPLSAATLVKAKLVYVVVASMAGVAISLATGPIIVLLLSGATNVANTLNRATVMTALVACPPGIVITGAIGIIVSCRVRSLQTASATATLSGMAGMLLTVSVAYALSTTSPAVTTLVATVAWLTAWFAYRMARSSVSPQVMIRTRGR